MNRLDFYLLLLSFFFIPFAPTLGQSAKLSQILVKADSLLSDDQDSSAYELLKQAEDLLLNEKDVSNTLLKDVLLGDYYFIKRNFKEARKAYETVWQNSSLDLAHELGVKVSKAINDLGIVYYRIGELDLAKKAHFKSLSLYQNYKDSTGFCYNYNNLSLVAKEQKEIDSAIYYAQKTNVLAKQLKDTLSIAVSYQSLAVIYLDNQQDLKGIEMLNKAKSILEHTNYESHKNHVKKVLASAYQRIGDHTSTKALLFDVLNYYKKSNNTRFLARTYIGIAKAYRDQKGADYDSATFYIQQAFDVLKETQNRKLLAQAYHMEGIIADSQKHYEKALASFQKSYQLLQGRYLGQAAAVMISMALTYEQLGDYQQVLSWVTKVQETSKKHISTGSLTKLYFLLYKSHKHFNQLEKALQYHELYLQQIKALGSREKNLSMARLEYRNQLEREKALEQAIQEKKDLAYQQKIDRQAWLIISMIGASILLVVIAIVIYRFYKTKQRAHIQLAHHAEELQTMNEEQRQLNEYLQSMRQKEQDLTEELQVAYEQLQKLDQSKTRFFANISHEFRTPLTVILGNLSNIKKESLTQATTIALDAIERNSQQLYQLINQLLDITKLEASRMPLKIQQEEVVGLLRSYFMSFESLVMQKGIDLHFQSSKPEFVGFIDRSVVEKIIYNLVSNAIKFTTKGMISLDVNVEGQSIVIMLSDTGIGISKAHLPHIFDRFYQVDTPTQQVYEGTGIGLALVKELVELHRGEIEVESEEGKGTTFTIHLAAAEEVFHTEEFVDDQLIAHAHTQLATLKVNTEAADATEPVLPPTSAKPLVLIVEDNVDLQALIKSGLKSDYEIIQAFDGQKGVDLAYEHIPNLIISDVMMPEKDGFELCKELKQDERTCHIPIVMLTARIEKMDKLHGLEIGADDYLAKPFDQQELEIRIDNLIQTRKVLQKHFAEKVDNMLYTPNEVSLTSADEVFVKNVFDIIEEHYGDTELNVEKLADLMNLSSRQLGRKIKAILGYAPSKLLQNFRLQKAQELLHDQNLQIGEVGFMVGFTSRAYFNRCFREKLNQTPKEYQAKLFENG
ncbi:MAG: ATP-binding protein [Flammeovirgaceae bacterium]